MISVPYEDIISAILEQKHITREELEARIKAKMGQLSGLISKEGAAHIVANELGIRVMDAAGGRLKVGKIYGGMRDVETVGRVTQVFEPREFEGRLGKGRVGSLMIGDETGQIRVVLWNEMVALLEKIKPGDIVKVVGGQARMNRDRKELHLSAKSKLIINPKGESVAELPYSEPAKRIQIAELKGDEPRVEIKATIVQVFDIRFYEVCPHCQKRLQPKGEEWECQVHSIVTPEYSYVLNLVVDDGTGNLRVVCFGREVENLTQKSREQLLGLRNNPEGMEALKTELLGLVMLFSGRAVHNKGFDRFELIARGVKPLDVDREIELLKARVQQEKQSGIPAQESVKGQPGEEEAIFTLPPSKKPEPDNEESDFDEFDIDEENI